VGLEGFCTSDRVDARRRQGDGIGTEMFAILRLPFDSDLRYAASRKAADELRVAGSSLGFSVCSLLDSGT